MQEVNEQWLDHLKNIEQDISSAQERITSGVSW